VMGVAAAVETEVKKGRGRWPKPEATDAAVGAVVKEAVDLEPSPKIRKKPGRKSKADMLAEATGMDLFLPFSLKILGGVAGHALRQVTLPSTSGMA